MLKQGAQLLLICFHELIKKIVVHGGFPIIDNKTVIF